MREESTALVEEGRLGEREREEREREEEREGGNEGHNRQAGDLGYV